MSVQPSVKQDTLVCIICEGPEEFDYLSKLNQLGVWHSRYCVDLVDAGGNGNLPARYQDKFQNGQYDIVLIFCDTDKKPFEQYLDVKRKIDFFHGGEDISNHVVIFGNPCTMQIILEHWADVRLKSPSKRSNQSIIAQCTGITDYNAHAKQRAELMRLITEENYRMMTERVNQLSSDDHTPNSTNFGWFMANLESEDASWISEINSLLF